jgi:phage baseplate assembly protein V
MSLVPLPLLRLLEGLRQRLSLIVARGKVLRTSDALSLPHLQVEGLKGEVLSDVEHVQQFGFRSRLRDGAGEYLAVCPGGDRASATVVGTADRGVRVVELASGETIVYDARGRFVHFAVDGLFVEGNLDAVTVHSSVKVRLEAPLVETTGDLHVEGDLAVDGDLVATGDVSDSSGTAQTMAAMRTNFNAHTHSAPGVTSGPSVLPVPAPNSPPM